MKLEAGMYVRTKEGLIFKIEKILNRKDHSLLFYGLKMKVIWNTDEIKASHNIIDLIEVGDYVNGSEVVFKDFNNLNEECLECGIGDYIVCSYEAKDIKTIVTKEQFEAIQYKVV